MCVNVIIAISERASAAVSWAGVALLGRSSSARRHTGPSPAATGRPSREWWGRLVPPSFCPCFSRKQSQMQAGPSSLAACSHNGRETCGDEPSCRSVHDARLSLAMQLARLFSSLVIGRYFRVVKRRARLWWGQSPPRRANNARSASDNEDKALPPRPRRDHDALTTRGIP